MVKSMVMKMIKIAIILLLHSAVPVTCTKFADFGFLLDSSASIGSPRLFRFQTQFLKAVLDNFKELYASSDGNIRAGVIVYGSEAKLEIKLNDFSDIESFKAALDEKIKYKGASLTRIDLALDMANKELFTEENGDRPNVQNYLVLITDGRQNSGMYFVDMALVPRNAVPLWNRNITIFTVGVARARRAQLRSIAGKQGTSIYTTKMEYLKEAVDDIVPKHCKGIYQNYVLYFFSPFSGLITMYSNKYYICSW